MHKRVTRGRAVAVLAGTAMASILPCARPALGQTFTKIRVATAPNDFSAAAYYAADMGFFSKAGLEVEVTSLNAGTVIIPAVVSGSFEFGCGSTPAIALAHQHGIPIVITAPAGAYSSKAPVEGLVIAKNSAIKTPRDLIGKTIALPSLKGGLATVGLSAWLDRNGLDAASIKAVEVPGIAVGTALASGRIDAAELLEPDLTFALAENARVFAHMLDAIGSYFVVGAYFCSADYAKAHPEIVVRFNSAIAAASVWANKNRVASGKILEKYTRVSVLPAMARSFYPTGLQSSDFQTLIDASAKYGFLSSAVPAASLFAPNIGR
jgi:NitT/TauT family transport system substrate-binding protein